MTRDGNSSLYADQRARDWEAFAEKDAPLLDYWQQWEQRSHGWRVPIEFVQPIGLDYPSLVEPLRPLIDALAALEEIDPVPTEWMHLTTVHVGFLMATDVMWSQVETFYVNASPRVRRIAPFEIAIGGLSVTEDGVYLGVDDGGTLREVRRQLRLGVPKVYEMMRDDPLVTADGDGYVPKIDIAFFTGEGERARVLAALEPFRDIDVGSVSVTQIKMARMPIQPHDHYSPIDVVAEMNLLGDDYRKGYHN